MTRTTFALIAGLLFAVAASAATPAAAPGDPMVPIRQFVDGFNTGNTKSAYAAYAANGVFEGQVKYGEPTRTEISGNSAYVIIPTVYVYKDHGKPTVEEGQMTYVLRSGVGGWKIAAWTWTWSGVKPHAPK